MLMARKNKTLTFALEMISRQLANDSTTEQDERVGLWIGLKTKAEMSSTSSRYSNFYEDEEGCRLLLMIDRQGKWKIHPCREATAFDSPDNPMIDEYFGEYKH